MNHRTPAEERLAAQLAAAPAVLARVHVHTFGQDGNCIVCDIDIVTWSREADILDSDEFGHIAIEGTLS